MKSSVIILLAITLIVAFKVAVWGVDVFASSMAHHQEATKAILAENR
jgi:hypothetical protein